MNKQSAPDYDPEHELLRARFLARQVRRSQRATWFPLLVFGVLMLAALPVTFAGHIVHAKCVVVAGGLPYQEVCRGYNSATFIYWPIALVLAYVVIAAYFVRRSRAHGVGTRVTPYVLAGIAISIALTAASVWAGRRPPSVRQHDVLGWHLQPDSLYRFIAPACAIGLALLVLAFVDRSPALLTVTVIYLVIAVAPIDFGWTISTHSDWAIAPHDVIPATVLLLASLGFALTQRTPQLA
jgi:hypothetical protein